MCHPGPGAGPRAFALAASLAVLWLAAFAVRYVELPGPLPDLTDELPVYPGLTTASLDHLGTLVQAAVLLASATGFGAWALKKARLLPAPTDALSRAAFGAGVGLGAYSLIGLLLGAAGLLDPYVFAAIPVVSLIVGRADLHEILATAWHDLIRALSVFSLYRVLIWAFPMLLFLIHVFHAFIPPLQYDVLEYHLAAPARYWRAGRVFFIHDNVYASFPQNVEMLYLWALVLKGQLFTGLYLAQMINVWLGLWATVVIACAARRLFGAGAAAPAAILFCVLPWTSELSTPAYVELALTGYAVLTLLSFCEYTIAPSWKWAALAGLSAGLAFGCKYPAALFLIAPLLVGIVIASRSDATRLWRHALVAAIAALLAASPWLVRNAVNTGNPTYPLLYSVFGGSTWSAEQAAKFARAHTPTVFAPGQLLGRTLRFFTQGDTAGRFAEQPVLRAAAYLVVLVLAAIGLVRARDRRVLIAAGYILLAWLLWLGFTHRIGRFLAPWTSLSAALAAGGLIAIRPLIAAQSVAVVTAIIASLSCYITLSPAAAWQAAAHGMDAPALLRIITRNANFSYEAIEKVNALGPGTRTLFLGEAETLYCTGDVVAPTVFDRHPLENLLLRGLSPEDVAAELARAGITHLYINLPELTRLRYSFDYQYEFNGQRRTGMWNLDEAQWRAFERFTKRFCRPEHVGGQPFDPRGLLPEDRHSFPAFARRSAGSGPPPCSYYLYRLISE